jgi:antitoxin (DNA-binding transcriptional repressor) of toxin-antitoxin stability system
MLASEPSLKIDISEAQIQLLHLLDLAIAGQEIVITQGDQPVTRLVSIAPKRSLFGSDKDKIFMSDDFDAPLPEFEEYS